MRVIEFVDTLVVALADSVEIKRRDQDSGFVFASRGDRFVAVDVFIDADATTVNVVRGLDFEPVEHVMGRIASAELAEEIAAMLRQECDTHPTIAQQLASIGDPRWPVERVLLVCAQAADHLEHALGWDGHGWETVRTAVRIAAAYLAGRMPTDADADVGPCTTDVLALRSGEFGYRADDESRALREQECDARPLGQE